MSNTDQTPMSTASIIEIIFITTAIFGTAFTVARALLESHAARKAAEEPIRQALRAQRT